MNTRLPITAWTLHTALGRGVDAHRDALRAQVSGLAAPSFALPFPTVVGEITQPLPALPDTLKRYDTRFARLVAASLADLGPAVPAMIKRWGADRVGVFLGTSAAGILQTEAHHADPSQPFGFLDHHTYDPVLKVVSALSGARGPAWVTSTACSSSAKVFGTAQRMIRAGLIDAAIIGGADTLCQLTLRGFNGLGVLSATPCRPLSAEPTGINIGEGGGLVLIEREGTARGYLLGVGESADAYHISSPHPEGDGAFAAMQGALRDAGLGPNDIGHINAHGTGTALNDDAESAAIARLFGDTVPVVSTKARTGHLLGGCGIVEAVLTLMALESKILPRSLGADPVNPEAGIHVPTQDGPTNGSAALSNTFAFGGNNVSLVFGV